LRHLPQKKRQTLFFSATMPAPIAALTKEMLSNPFTLNLQRQAAPAVGITQAVYPVAQDLKSGLLVALLKRGDMPQALVFTRTKHRANRLAAQLVAAGIKAERIHGNRSQAQRTQALAGFKDGDYQVLVATDIAARGIDVEALGHVVNFDVPLAAEDYIHRVGRTARAEATGEAFTFVSPDEEGDLKQIERAIKKTLPRVTVPDFDYSAKPQTKLEVPLAERIAEIRKKKAEDRARAAAKVERRNAAQSGGARPASPAGGRSSGGGRSSAPAKPAGESRGPSSRGPSSGGSGGSGGGASKSGAAGRVRRGPHRGQGGGSGGGRSGGGGSSSGGGESPYA
jgi:ATP-dependent RNA helicase RhlE